MVSDRIAKQKDRLLKTKPTVCVERARIYTECYRSHQDQPLVITRALALEETLRGMSIYIDEGELIVGNQSSRPRAAPIFPEYAVGWILNELDAFAGGRETLSTRRKKPRQRCARSAHGGRERLFSKRAPPSCLPSCGRSTMRRSSEQRAT